MSRTGRDIRVVDAVMVAGTDAPSAAANVFADTDDHDLIQRRLGVTYGIFALTVVGFFVLVEVFLAITQPFKFWADLLTVSKLLHVLTAAFLGLAWHVCRGKPRATGVLYAIDLGGTFGIISLNAVSIAGTPPGVRVEMVLALIFVLVVSLRAALVPSPPRWTVIVSAISAIPVPIGAYVVALRDPTWAVERTPREAVLVFSSGWCVAGIAAAWAISRVVYGLRAEVKTAMRLGQYTLEEKIGEGGMGAVYRARHALLRRPTAIKLLSADRTGATDVKRFEREVQLTSKLTHPNTIAIYDFGHTRAGVFYYAMELIEGLSLEELCKEDGPQPPGRVVFVLAQVASALAEAHDIGLVHRDVKPANILLSSRGGLPDFVKVLDFGLVKETSQANPAVSTANAITGTPLYMAPESILRPDAIDARVDLYALGGVAYWLLTGSPPFEGANLVEICSHHLHTPPVPPSSHVGSAAKGGTVPAALDALVLKCLAKKPGERPASARDLAVELRALQRECPWSEEDARGWWEARAARTDLRSNLAKT